MDKAGPSRPFSGMGGPGGMGDTGGYPGAA